METTLVTPSPQQLAWQEAELALFLHFGINTFTDREWGDGQENPQLFNPTGLDADQWVQTARDTGFKLMILTAKHHDGFCLWPSRYTEHSVKRSPWKKGRGDVVREFADACRKAGMKLGLYLSPWDRHERIYGDSAAYNQFYKHQMTELLTEYGEVTEAWFDGACGEGPNGKRQVYDWASYYAIIRRLQPKALIAISGPDVRWVGNEDGVARETEWSVQEPNATFHPGITGKVWYPAECDVSIRPGWFWHRGEDSKLKSLDHLLDIYYKSVGRNSVLLLNVPPNDRGLIAEPDVRRLRELRQALDRTFATDLVAGRMATASSARDGCPPEAATDGRNSAYWAPADDDTRRTLEVDLGREESFDRSMVQEQIAHGQRVEEYRVDVWQDGAWKSVAQGTTIGHKKLDRFPLVGTNRVKLTIGRALASPQIRRFGVFRSG